MKTRGQKSEVRDQKSAIRCPSNLWLLLLLLFAFAPSARAAYSWQTYDYQETLASNNSTRYFRIAWPDDYTYVRGILVNFNASSGDTRAEYLKPYFKEFLRLHQLAFIGSWKLDVSPGSSQALIVFTNALTSFASQSGHGEITNAPYAIFVHSGGSGPGWAVIKAQAPKVLGWSDGSGGVGAPPIVAQSDVLPIPVSMWAGSADVTGVANALESFIATNRPSGLRGSYAVIQGGTHPDSLLVHGIGMANLHEVIGLSYPTDQCVVNGPITLNRIAESSGWLIATNTIRTVFASVTNWSAYTGNRSNAHWVPNRNMAYVYRAFASHSPPISLSAPANESEVNPGVNVTVTVNDAAYAGWTHMAVFNFGTNIANFTSGTPSFVLPNVQSGLYILSAVATRGGTNVTTRPIMLSVRMTAAPSYPCVSPGTWFAATNGTAGGTGSISSPWDLQTALDKIGTVESGDTVWLRAGNYTHLPQGVTAGNEGYIFRATLSGTAGNVITFRTYPPDKAAGALAEIDGGAYGGATYGFHANTRPTLMVGISGDITKGNYLRFQDIVIKSSSTQARFSGDDSSFPSSITRSDGFMAFGIGVELINSILHDCTAGISALGGATTQNYNQIYYGNLCYNNGWQGTPNRHGHGFYLQQFPNLGIKTISRNITTGNYHKGMQIYGSGTAYICGFRVYQNLLIGVPGESGALLVGTRTGTANRMQDDQVTDNFGYGADFANYQQPDADSYVDLRATGNYLVNSFIQASSWQSLVFTNNFIISPTLTQVVSLWTNDFILPWTFDYNKYVVSNSVGYQAFRIEGHAPVNFATWTNDTGYDVHSTVTAIPPSGTNYVILQNNAYDPARAQVFIYNWTATPTIALNVAGLGWPVGANVIVHNVQDYFGDAPVQAVTPAGTLVLDLRAIAHSVAVPYGDTGPVVPKTFPAFGAFILENIGAVIPPAIDTTTLTVLSVNPDAGVTVLMTPADLDGLSNGTTLFARTVVSNSVTTLTAPLTSTDGNVFSKWQRQGTDYSVSQSATFTNSIDTFMTAVYATPIPPLIRSASGGGASARRALRY